MRPLFEKHMDDIITGDFSRTMMEDWANDDATCSDGARRPAKPPSKQTLAAEVSISEQEYFDKGILMVAMIKAGVELAFDTMVRVGIKAESAYYESLHETPLIANLIARKKLYEMNVVISDTAEYGCYLFAHAAVPLLADFMKHIDTDVIGKGLAGDNGVDNQELIAVNSAIRSHPVELVGRTLRSHMTAMKKIR